MLGNATPLGTFLPLAVRNFKDLVVLKGIRAVFGGDRLRYWQCVMVFAIWYCARIKFKFPGTLTGKI